MRIWSWTVCVLLLLITGCQSPGRVTPTATVFVDSGIVHLPLRVDRNQPLVRARVNGGSPTTFLIDTGAQLSVIPRALADELGIPVRRHYGFFGGVTRREWGRIYIGELDSIEVDEIRFEGVEAVVLDDDDGEHFRQPILGFGLFDDCVFAIDFGAARLSVVGADSPSASSLLEGRAIDYDLRHYSPEIEMSVGHVSLDVLLDTGFNGGLFFPDRVAGRLPLAAPPKAIGLVETINAREELRVARLEQTVAFGDFRIESPIVACGSGAPLMGVQLLREFRLAFDPARRKVYFRRDGSGPIETPAIHGFGFLSRREPGGTRVISVVEDGPAARAGLRVDDRILGRDRRGKRLRLTIDRGGADRTISIEYGVLVE